MNILVLNVGSSSLKFQLIDTDATAIAESTRPAARARADRAHRRRGDRHARGERQPAGRRRRAQLRDHAAAVEYVIAVARRARVRRADLDASAEIEAVGHRVVHGGERFTHSTRIDDEVWRELEELIELAPLHNPHNLRGITRRARGARRRRSAGRRVRHGVPSEAARDARTSTRFRISSTAATACGATASTARRTATSRIATASSPAAAREETKIITLHLGNGASACAIVGGSSVDTSMGFTPLEGLVMGTRSGDLDPAILDFIAVEGRADAAARSTSMLNKQSGLLGVSGLTADMRELLAEDGGARRPARAAGDRALLLSREEVPRRVSRGDERRRRDRVRRRHRRELAAGPRADLRGLDWLGIAVDAARRTPRWSGKEGRFDADGSRVELWVIPTDEELLIARDTWRVVTGADVRY